MSSRPSSSSGPFAGGEHHDLMNMDDITESQSSSTAISGQHHPSILIRDRPNWLRQMGALQASDIIILLTPVISPVNENPSESSDPFEPLGRALAWRHTKIRHIPYTRRLGLTPTHEKFIARGQIIILCLYIEPGKEIKFECAEKAFAICEEKPVLIVIYSQTPYNTETLPYPTIIQTIGISPIEVERTGEATAQVIFGQLSSSATIPPPEPRRTSLRGPKVWPIEEWTEARDMPHVLTLWRECIHQRFHLDEQTLASLLRRSGYAKHYVVRDTTSGDLLGFCATYLSYVDQQGEKLIASLAMLLVRSTSRKQGIGLSLHSHAVSQLKRTRGVMRLQFGSVFPRILYGPPLDSPLDEEWFKRRGWQLNEDRPGHGKPTYDLILDIDDWRTSEGTSEAPTKFQPCKPEDMNKVLEFVERASIQQGRIGWFDQYLSFMHSPYIKDVILGDEDDQIVATALTYTPSGGSQISLNLPWAGSLGSDVGGVTCICIASANSSGLLASLLGSCIEHLRDQGMRRVFLDGAMDNIETLEQLGFREWARYRDVWKDV